MRYIDNVSEVIDFSGETPVTVVSNNVRTYLNQPTVIPHCPGRQSCRCCRSACDIFRREEDFHDNCRAREDCRRNGCGCDNKASCATAAKQTGSAATTEPIAACVCVCFCPCRCNLRF
ncbi:MAG: hypothetical protein ACLU1U_07215 [Lachnospiraceae bacterium]